MSSMQEQLATSASTSPLSIVLDSVHHYTPLILPSTYFSIGLLVSLALGILTYRLFTIDSLVPGFEVVGVDKNVLSLSTAKSAYMKNSEQIISKGLKEFDRPFQIVSNVGPKIVFPSRYLDQLKNNKALSFKLFSQDIMLSHLWSFKPMAVSFTSNAIEDVARTRLTQSLGAVSKPLCEEADDALQRRYGQATEWTPLNIREHVNLLVSQLSARVFLGDRVCRDEEWVGIAVDYTIEVFQAARQLRLWPQVLRPIAQWVLPECKTMRATTAKAKRIVNAEIARRQLKSRPDSKATKTADSLAWLREHKDGDWIDLTSAQLSLSLAAIHTTSDLLVKCLYALCKYPEYQEPLRREMIEVLTENGWSKTSLYQMKLLDSFMKEIQRLYPVGNMTLERIAAHPLTLDDGTHIPKGTRIDVAKTNEKNPNIYTDPETFDGYRFLRMRSQPGQENHWQFVTVSAEHTGFGLGMHACPGRFFASNEVKIAMIFLLMRFDWRRDCKEDEPIVLNYGAELIANPGHKISFKSREPELDLLALAA